MSKLPTRSRTDIEKQCPQCLRPVNRRMDFCLDCGDFIEPTNSSSKSVTRSGRQRAVTAPQAREARRVLRGSPLKTPVLLLGGLLATILLGLFALTVYECCSNFDASHKDSVRLAESYLANGDEANAISVLERSILEEKKPKQEQRQILLDRALFALASKMVAQGKYHDAVTCYSRISPGFEHHDEVLKLIAEYSDKALPVIFGAGAESADKGQDVSPVGILMHHSGAAKSANMSRLEKAVMTVVPSPSSSSSSGATAKTTIKPSNKSTLSAPAIGPAPVLAPIAAPGPKSAPRLSERTTVNSIPNKAALEAHSSSVNSSGTSSVNGIARYNELLADYFVRHSGGATEPPSYEEWVKSGTKDF
jgi:hypothetical protein